MTVNYNKVIIENSEERKIVRTTKNSLSQDLGVGRCLAVQWHVRPSCSDKWLFQSNQK